MSQLNGRPSHLLIQLQSYSLPVLILIYARIIINLDWWWKCDFNLSTGQKFNNNGDVCSLALVWKADYLSEPLFYRVTCNSSKIYSTITSIPCNMCAKAEPDNVESLAQTLRARRAWSISYQELYQLCCLSSDKLCITSCLWKFQQWPSIPSTPGPVYQYNVRICSVQKSIFHPWNPLSCNTFCRVRDKCSESLFC